MTEADWLICEDPNALVESELLEPRRARLFACACVRSVWHLLTDQHSRDVVVIGEQYADGEVGSEMDRAYQLASQCHNGLEIPEDTSVEYGLWHAAGDACTCASPYANMIVDDICFRPWAPLAAHLFRDIIGNPFRPIVRRPAVAPGDQDAELSLMEWRRAPNVLRLAEAAYLYRPGTRCPQCHGSGHLMYAPARGPFVARFADPGGPSILEKPPPLTRKPCHHCHGAGYLKDGALDPARLAILADALMDAGCDNDLLLGHLRSPGPHVRGCAALDLLLARR